MALKAERNDFMTRKDSKGRNLKSGETQRRDGLYMFRYMDKNSGKRLVIYEKDLVSLRNREKQIERDMEDGIITDQRILNITVNELFEMYMATKILAKSTRANYISMWNHFVRNELGILKVVSIKPSHIKLFYAKLSENGLSHNTIKLLHNMIYPSFEMAVDDDLIRKNPSKDTLKDYGAEPKKKVALTVKQQKEFLEFVANSSVYNVYLPLFQIMIETGFRCGEIIGLTWSDVDMKKRVISIKHQLVYKDFKDGKGYCFHITTPKTQAGIRKFPMTDIVYKAFECQREQNVMLGLRGNTIVDGVTGYIFNSKNDRPLMPNALNNVLYNIINTYNQELLKKSKAVQNQSEPLPNISAHVLRHTGCTRMAESGMDIKVIQYLMGHANIDVTMDVYNHITERSRIDKELQKLNSFVV